MNHCFFPNRNEANYPLHIVKMSHASIDLEVLDNVHGFVGRPNLTLGVDVYSRMIWCMYISLEENFSNVIRKALMQGMFPKRSKERFETINGWDIYGRPHVIVADNSSCFRSAHFRRMVEHTMGSELRYVPHRTPHVGGTIEHLCGSFMTEFIDRIDGTRKRNPIESGKYDAESKACLTLSELIKLATWFVTDVYHHKVHKGLPPETPTPTTRYYEGLKKVAFLPEHFNSGYEEFIAMEMLPVTAKRVNKAGVRFNNVIYNSQKLAPYAGNGRKYNVKYDIDDISKIYFQTPESLDYLEVPAVNPPVCNVKGMSLFTFNE